MINKGVVKSKLTQAVCVLLSCTLMCTAFAACNTDKQKPDTPPVSHSDSAGSKIEVNTADSKSEYYAEKIEGNYDYTAFRFVKDYKFYSDEGIDVIAYTGGTSGDEYDNCISIYPSSQSIEEALADEMNNAELLGYSKVQKAAPNSEIPIKHQRIIASQPDGEGVIENAESEIYIFEHGKECLVVCVNYTTKTKDSIYDYLIAMVKTIELK